MTQSQGEMREMQPETGEVYRYRIEELEGEAREGLNPRITLSIESRESGEGLCRTESGRPHAWAWVGPELRLWLDGALFVFHRAEARRRGNAPSAEVRGDVLAPMPARCWKYWSARGTGWSGTRLS